MNLQEFRFYVCNLYTYNKSIDRLESLGVNIYDTTKGIETACDRLFYCIFEFETVKNSNDGVFETWFWNKAMKLKKESDITEEFCNEIYSKLKLKINYDDKRNLF